MTDSPEMQDRFMTEILEDFYARMAEFDPIEEVAIVLSGDEDGTYRATVVAGGDSTMGKASAQSWFDAVQKAVGRSIARLDAMKEVLEALGTEE